MAATRIDPRQAHRDLESDSGAMLVCAYDDDQKFEQNRLEGAISFGLFKAEANRIPKTREIIFYCA